ncbi:hypothetical protein TVNIR_0178 [Thioalkalivibrio nitratireducens DSM 14787]|uniref:Uncharacterized protein n=1 Tax=Thioalkalivibrio nitratireducens (strain DSM 14787 / UNIQEM 213 / ALEN2) TaxID=1255043 RepID=L0DU86_THIND|nr:hypothetical protein TVNIR_0178 [Thioalkalivibrio nitratireducens DSM 14787]
MASAQRQGEDPLRAFTAVARDDWAAVKGYYRLIDQPADSEVTPGHILAPHRARSAGCRRRRRCCACRMAPI